MGKSMGTIGLVIGAAAIALFCYLVDEVWAIFGVWPMILSIVINLFAETILGQFIGSKKQTPNGYMFNPQELPKFLAILISLLVGYYLYSQLNSKELSSYERNFGMFYLVIAIVLPIAKSLYVLFRDRNDYVEIDGEMLKYRNNDDIGEISLNLVSQIQVAGSDLKLILNGGEEFVLKTSEMNFNASDLLDIISVVNSHLPAQA